MNLNPAAVVLWVFFALAAYLFSGTIDGTLTGLLVGLGITLIATVITSPKRRRF